jgi:hypothetical protein
MISQLFCAIGLHRLKHSSGSIFVAFLSPRFVAGRLECTRCGLIDDDGFR